MRCKRKPAKDLVRKEGHRPQPKYLGALTAPAVGEVLAAGGSAGGGSAGGRPADVERWGGSGIVPSECADAVRAVCGVRSRVVRARKHEQEILPAKSWAGVGGANNAAAPKHARARCVATLPLSEEHGPRCTTEGARCTNYGAKRRANTRVSAQRPSRSGGAECQPDETATSSASHRQSPITAHQNRWC